jgi:hypothetical protein
VFSNWFTISNFAKLLTRTSQVRGELKTKMRSLTASFFGFRSSNSNDVIRQNRDLAESLKDGSVFAFKVHILMIYMVFQVLTLWTNRIGSRRRESTRWSYCNRASMSCSLQIDTMKASSTINILILCPSKLSPLCLQLWVSYSDIQFDGADESLVDRMLYWRMVTGSEGRYQIHVGYLWNCLPWTFRLVAVLQWADGALQTPQQNSCQSAQRGSVRWTVFFFKMIFLLSCFEVSMQVLTPSLSRHLHPGSVTWHSKMPSESTNLRSRMMRRLVSCKIGWLVHY